MYSKVKEKDMENRFGKVQNMNLLLLLRVNGCMIERKALEICITLTESEKKAIG